MKQLIKLDDAARRLGIHITTVRAWVRQGRVPAYRLGQRYTRVDWDEVLAALSEPRVVDQEQPGVREVVDAS